MKFDIEVVLRIVVPNDGSVQIFPEHPPRVARNTFFEEDSTRERADSPETLAYIQTLEIVLAKPNYSQRLLREFFVGSQRFPA